MSEEKNIKESSGNKEQATGDKKHFPEDPGLAEHAPQPQTTNDKPETSDMEVHHHSHSHGKKNWKSYFWEFLMLFLAVFCGFLAEYQLEHKIEKDREKSSRLGLARAAGGNESIQHQPHHHFKK